MEHREGREVGEKESGTGETKRKRGGEAGERVKRAKRDRSVQIIVCSSEWNQCMLNSVNKFQNVDLVTN